MVHRDPYESSMIEVRPSSMMEAGEGVFLKQDVAPNTVLAFYNGIRIPDTSASDSWEECSYRIFIRRNEDDEEEEDVLDIPRHLRDTSSYCATLAHKINHSFRPNCKFSDYHHPVYGHIRCVVSLSHLTSGTEISVHYNYCLDDCPQWYADFWNNENSCRG